MNNWFPYVVAGIMVLSQFRRASIMRRGVVSPKPAQPSTQPAQPVAPVKMRAARGPLKRVELFPDLPRTPEELRYQLSFAKGVERERIIDRLTELEEQSYRSMDDIEFADDQQILDDIRGR